MPGSGPSNGQKGKGKGKGGKAGGGGYGGYGAGNFDGSGQPAGKSSGHGGNRRQYKDVLLEPAPMPQQLRQPHKKQEHSHGPVAYCLGCRWYDYSCNVPSPLPDSGPAPCPQCKAVLDPICLSGRLLGSGKGKAERNGTDTELVVAEPAPPPSPFAALQQQHAELTKHRAAFAASGLTDFKELDLKLQGIKSLLDKSGKESSTCLAKRQATVACKIKTHEMAKEKQAQAVADLELQCKAAKVKLDEAAADLRELRKEQQELADQYKVACDKELVETQVPLPIQDKGARDAANHAADFALPGVDVLGNLLTELATSEGGVSRENVVVFRNELSKILSAQVEGWVTAVKSPDGKRQCVRGVDGLDIKCVTAQAAPTSEAAALAKLQEIEASKADITLHLSAFREQREKEAAAKASGVQMPVPPPLDVQMAD
jgi:hypothetical protein